LTVPSHADIGLTTPVEKVPGIPPAIAASLRALGLTSVGRLVAHLPMRHEVLEAESSVRELVPGRIGCVRGLVTACRPVARLRRPRFEAVLMDQSGRLDLVWFNQPYLAESVRAGARLRVQGLVRRFDRGIQMVNPRLEMLPEGDGEPGVRERMLRPVYPAGEGATPGQIARTIHAVLPAALAQIEDHLPAAFRAKRSLPPLADAYRMMHAPETEEDFGSARRRLAYDELLLMQLGVHIKRAHRRRVLRAPALAWSDTVDRHVRARLPFELTPGQDAVVRQVALDLSSTTPANRLVQGDVGSGKTAVAVYALLMAVASGHQGAMMAPTELLAEQHFASVTSMLAGSRVRVELLTGATPAAERESILERVERGDVDVLIGTHALLTESVRFGSLAVAVVDEQHRFGVHQRASLRAKAGDETSTPHMLVMTATPIPRTLALTLFGDLDMSTIVGMPPGRHPVRTRVEPPERRAEVYAWVRQRLDMGEQAYIVSPAIDAGEGSMADVRSLLTRLEERELAGKRLAALHGQLTRAARERVMQDFREGRLDAVVATTVIEVGVDVPAATVMVIDNAERFGLSQLHQLRGRVGRGESASWCVLIADPTTDEARARLEVMARTSDGFEIAQRDLELRGPGDVFGARQSGLAPLCAADLSRDVDLLALARRDAAEWIERSPDLARPDEALLLRRLKKRHGEWLGLGDVG
jgi:ATP-dependent DNA helicase RecG